MDDSVLASLLSGGQLDLLADAVTVVGPDWRLRHVSPSLLRTVHRTADDLLGRDLWEVFPEAVGLPQQAEVQRAMTERVAVRATWSDLAGEHWYAQRCVPLDDGLLVLTDEVTEQHRAGERAERLVEVGEALAAATTPEQVNEVVLAAVLPQLGATDGSIVLVDDERGVMRPLGWLATRPEAAWSEYPVTRPTPGSSAYLTGRSVFLDTPEQIEERYPDVAAIARDRGRQAIAALPLLADGRRVGVLVVGFDRPGIVRSGDRQFLTTAAAMVAQALVRASLLDVERRSVSLLQRSLLPQALPDIDGLRTAVRYVASDAAAQVGGDWYDVIPLPGGAVALVLGDVEGHDLEAAALMGLVRSAVRAYALEGHPPSVLMSRANAFLAGLRLGRIVTLGYSQLHPRELLVTAVSAGHLPTIVALPSGEVAEIPAEVGPPLGVLDEGLHWPETTSTLPQDAVLTMFTDGLVEVRGEDISRGLDRVRDVLRSHREAPVERLAELLLASRGASHDDVALLTARLTARATVDQRVVRRLPASPASVVLARQFARQLLAAWRLPADRVERAELVVSELVTNAARHSEDDVELGLGVTPTRLRIEVGDTSHRMPSMDLTPPHDDATSGRGLLLVDAVASRWGIESDGLAKTVWAEIDL